MSPRTGAARRRALARDRMGLMRIRRDVISMNPLASSLPFHEPPMAMHCSPFLVTSTTPYNYFTHACRCPEAYPDLA